MVDLYPFTPEKLATLGAALRLKPGTRVLDLGSGSGEMLCTWARDYGIIGTGIDIVGIIELRTTSRRGAMAALSPTFSCFPDSSRLSVTSAMTSWKWYWQTRTAGTEDEFAKEVRARLPSEPERYATYTREYLGWGVFALMTR